MEKTTISNYFNSQDFLKVLAMVTNQESPNSFNITTNVGALMEKAFNFMKLTNFTAKPEQITDFLTDVAKIHNQTSDRYFSLNYKYNSAFLRHYCKANSIDFNQIDNPDCSYIKTNIAYALASNAYKFHGTNSSIVPSISANGLLPNKSPNEDIEEITNIFYSHGREYFLPWKTGERGNEVFFSMTPTVSYSYAVRSPEWFDTFIGSDYFQTRDYEKAKQSVNNSIKKYNLNEQEQEKVSSFFEKYWNMYANSKPTIIAVPNPAEESLELADFAVEMAKQEESVEEALEIGLGITGNKAVDVSTKDRIDVSDAIFIEMPDLVTIQSQIRAIQLETEAQQNNEQQVEDIKQQYQEPIQQGHDIAREQDIETCISM